MQGYLGGRMTYDHGVGVYDGGQFAQTAHGASALNVALARGTSRGSPARTAFSATGLGCAAATATSPRASAARPRRRARARRLPPRARNGLFPPAAVSDRDFQAINAWLRTLQRRGGGDEG